MKSAMVLVLGMMSIGCEQPVDDQSNVVYVVVAHCLGGCSWRSPKEPSDIFVTQNIDAARGKFILDADMFKNGESPDWQYDLGKFAREVIDQWNPPEINAAELETTPVGTSHTFDLLVYRSLLAGSSH
jgi:hypothetical protein